MMGAILSAVVSWLFKGVLIKFVIFTVMYVVVTAVIGYISSKVPSANTFSNSFATWTPAMWYFADITLFTQFFPALMSALILRFAIRRIPFIG